MLSQFFNDAATGHDAVAEDDGTTILSNGRRSHFSCSHCKHHRHFTHPDSTLPDLCIYQETRYFSAFCSQIECVYNDKVDFAFSSALSMNPNPQVVSDDESDSESDINENKEWISPTSISSSNYNTETGNHLSQYFELGISLSYFDVKVQAGIVV